MKIWVGHGSEHSNRLVMIGRFVDAAAASATKNKLELLNRTAEEEIPEPSWDRPDEALGDAVRDVLNSLRIYDLSRADMDNFLYDYQVEVSENTIRLSTEESEVQGFLKVLIGAGASVKVYSAHNWDEDGDVPRGSSDDLDEQAVAEDAG